MKKLNFLKIVKIAIALLTAGKAIHDEIKTKKTGVQGLTDPVDNTDPQNPSYPPKK